MAKFELTKSIEARKLNKRSGLPLPEPPVTISFGSIIENLEEIRGMGRFHYLFELFECDYTVLQRALHPVDDGSPAESEMTSVPTAAPAERASAAAQPAVEVKFRWEEITSTHGTVLRAKVPGGWLVLARGASLAFYPDAKHGWDGTTVA